MAKSKSTTEVNKTKASAENAELKRKSSGKEVITGNTEDESEINECAAQIEALNNELAAERDKFLRLAAEYDNFRKRSAKEREMIYTDARIDAVSKLLPVYDNLERALKTECNDESYYKGVEMIMTQLTETLSSMGIQEIPATGESFDPKRHNAVMTIVDPGLGENIIAEEYQKGFILGDRVIRFSTVVVAN